MKLRKLSTGNYIGYYKGYYVFVLTKIVDCKFYSVSIGKKGKWLFSEGFHSSYFKTIPKVKQWAKEITNSTKEK